MLSDVKFPYNTRRINNVEQKNRPASTSPKSKYSFRPNPQEELPTVTDNFTVEKLNAPGGDAKIRIEALNFGGVKLKYKLLHVCDFAFNII